MTNGKGKGKAAQNPKGKHLEKQAAPAPPTKGSERRETSLTSQDGQLLLRGTRPADRGRSEALLSLSRALSFTCGKA